MEMLLLGSVFLVMGLVGLQWYRQRKKQRKRIYSTLELIGAIKKLISFTQKHRGLTATYLQGDPSVETALRELKQGIEELVNLLGKDTIVTDEARWIAYCDHWRRLKDKALNLTVTTSFQQHTHLIETLLYLLEDVAENVEFTHCTNATSHTHFLWHEFPRVIEFVGQARAIGVAVSTRGESTQIDKVKLGYLCEKINILSNQSCERLSLVQTESTSEQIEQAKQACMQLTQTIQEQLINVTSVKLDNQRYFQLASTTMDKCNLVFDKEINAIKLSYRKYN
ncbi:hypothetical protein D210916BOD24_12680 [Alteromonas sp. D210916BOD_24]|uniref:nitrate- and nitrite sensing domain-containing protein n=1 Tax=Alteromonas sp. D210916BOD_24 TaxID=3157618 RepID=UPI00399CBE65